MARGGSLERMEVGKEVMEVAFWDVERGNLRCRDKGKMDMEEEK